MSNSHEDGNGSRLSLRHEAKRKFLRGLIGRAAAASVAACAMTVAYSVQGPVQSSSGVVNIIPMPPDGTGVNLNIGVTQ